MVLVSLDARSQLLERLRSTSQFGLNVLSKSQVDLAVRFARKGADDFAGLEWSEEEGCPRFQGAAVWLACRIDDLIEGGDHWIALGRVLRIQVADAEPLTYHERRFGTHAQLG
jgi:flavin reductase (DIM6/NTAB) family NADH-FMN oxidoreductase RutF